MPFEALRFLAFGHKWTSWITPHSFSEPSYTAIFFGQVYLALKQSM